jgi:hypothetical protein
MRRLRTALSLLIAAPCAGPVAAQAEPFRDDTITAWRVVSASATGTACLLILDRIGAGRFEIVDRSATETLHAGMNEILRRASLCWPRSASAASPAVLRSA